MIVLYAFIGVLFLTNYFTKHVIYPKFGEKTVLSFILEFAVFAFLLYLAHLVPYLDSITSPDDWGY